MGSEDEHHAGGPADGIDLDHCRRRDYAVSGTVKAAAMMQLLLQRAEPAEPSSLPSLFLPVIAVLLVGLALVLFVRHFRRSDSAQWSRVSNAIA
ncbi:MAG: hypothetical protein ACLQME_17355 [Alphaproteobacteria bacterium]